MLRILLCSLFLISCSSVPAVKAEPAKDLRDPDNFIIVNTMCDLPVKIMYQINGIKDGRDINPYDKYELMNLKTFLTIFTPDQKYEAPLNKALLIVARIKCDP